MDDVPDRGGPAGLTPLSLALVLTLGVFALYVTASGALMPLSVPLALWVTQLAVFLGFPHAVLRAVGQRPARGPGLWPFRAGLLGWGAVAGVLNYAAWAMPLAALSQAVLPERLVDLFDGSRLFEHQLPVERVATGLSVVVAAAVAEEYFFRGVLLRALASRLAPSSAVVLSALLFSAFHLDPVGFLPRFQLGVVFGLLYLHTGSLWPGIGAHAANNLVATGLFLLTDLSPDAEVPTVAVAGGFVVGNALLALVVRTAARSWRPSPWDGSPGPRTPFFLALAPWAAVAMLLVGLTVSLDERGIALRAFERAHPLPRHLATRPELEALRNRARRGEVPLESYYDARRLMSPDDP